MAPVRELSRCELRALAGGAQCTNGNDPHALLYDDPNSLLER
jgi:hypothetical protein